MKKLLTGAVAAALAASAIAAPAASASAPPSVCGTAGNLAQKYLGPQFEDVMVHMGDEIPLVVGTACSVTG